MTPTNESRFQQWIAQTKPVDWMGSGLPCEPTKELPASDAKIKVMLARYEARQALFHPADAALPDTIGIKRPPDWEKNLYCNYYLVRRERRKLTVSDAVRDAEAERKRAARRQRWLASIRQVRDRLTCRGFLVDSALLIAVRCSKWRHLHHRWTWLTRTDWHALRAWLGAQGENLNALCWTASYAATTATGRTLAEARTRLKRLLGLAPAESLPAGARIEFHEDVVCA